MAYTITYRPEPWTKAEHELGRTESHPEALEMAAGYARQYYGENSPIIVRDGRKKIVEIPAGAGR